MASLDRSSLRLLSWLAAMTFAACASNPTTWTTSDGGSTDSAALDGATDGPRPMEGGADARNDATTDARGDARDGGCTSTSCPPGQSCIAGRCEPTAGPMCSQACATHAQCVDWCGAAPSGSMYCCSANGSDAGDGICYQAMGSCDTSVPMADGGADGDDGAALEPDGGDDAASIDDSP